MSKVLPPYVSATGLLKDLFDKIRQAPPPPRFSQDYLFSNLKFKKSGSTLPFIPLLKKIGFLTSEGAPTDIYRKFRNPDPKISGKAMAEAIKTGYSDLYNRNEYWHTLDKTKLKNFLVENLELEPRNQIVNYLTSTIEILKLFANFEPQDLGLGDHRPDQDQDTEGNSQKNENEHRNKSAFAGLNLSYTINLNLPETSDVKVFDAIFKSLKENLLKK